MASKNTNSSQQLLNLILKQIAGDVDAEHALIPEYAIVGTGDIMCYDPNDRMFKKIPRGTRGYIIKENFDYMGRNLMYTVYGDLVCIDPQEIYLLKDFD